MSSIRTALIKAAMPDLADEGHRSWSVFYAALSDGGLVNGALAGRDDRTGAWQLVTTEFAAGVLAFIRGPRDR